MIPISWDSDTSRWIHHMRGQEVCWGIEHKRIPYHPGPFSSTFTCLQTKNNPTKAGPLIGILSSKRPDVPFIGNVDRYKRITNHIHAHGGVVFIYTLESITGNCITGYVYDSPSDNWIQATFPFPDFVYNRIAIRSDEEDSRFFKFIQLLEQRSIPYYNRSFFSKWHTYLAFQNCKALTPFLPDTKLLCSYLQFEEFLDTHKTIIIKPVRSSQGKGVFSLSKMDEDRIVYASNHERMTYHKPEFIEQMGSFFTGEHLMQQMVDRKEHKDCPYDYRVLVHKLSGKWVVTGIGVRWAGVGKLTTHVPAGGKLLSLEEVPVGHSLIEMIAAEAGAALQRFYHHVGEFSMDIGVDRSNHYWLFEVNAKPMPFDEPDIERKSIDRFYHQVLEATGFPDGHDIFQQRYTHTK